MLYLSLTTQHNTTQHNTTQHNTTQHNTTQHNTTLCCTITTKLLSQQCSVRQTALWTGNLSYRLSVLLQHLWIDLQYSLAVIHMTYATKAKCSAHKLTVTLLQTHWLSSAIYSYGAVIYCKYFLLSKSSKQRHGSLHLAFVKIQIWHFAWFSPGTFHSPVSTLTPMPCTYTLTTFNATQSLNSAASLTKTSVCVRLKNINKETIQQAGVFISRKLRIGIWVWTSVRCYVVREGTGT